MRQVGREESVDRYIDVDIVIDTDSYIAIHMDTYIQG